MKTLLAVSGGIDSMCMADIYSHTEEEYAIAHCNFHLRGEDSNADADLVQKWAASHGVRFFCADFDTDGYARENGISIEMAAREQRYDWFAFIAETQGFDAVATAHNANDNAETLILNLLRGTGSRGLRGISPSSPLSGSHCHANRLTSFGPSHKWVTPSYVAEGGTDLQDSAPVKEGVKLIRPMLGMSRADIEKYAQEHNVPYREDRTNAESIYKRNRIRNIIFPEFEKINPSFIRTLNADIDRFRQVDDIAEDYFRDNIDKVFDGSRLNVPALLSLKHRDYVLFRILEPYGFSAQVLDSVITLLGEIAGGKEVTFSGKTFKSETYILETSADAMTIRPIEEDDKDGPMIISEAGRYRFNGQDILIEEMDYIPGMNLRTDDGTLMCDAGMLPFPFVLRRWEVGDWMRPFGMHGQAKKVSDIFTDLKISRYDKEKSVMVISSSLDARDSTHVAAIAGYRMDEALRISKGSIHIVKISVI